ncbi:diguanylate cyclase [Sneathiella sp.]|uniref:sensor domain-containing diguanylate cyclase n=1 Tax=Sneathiella sp. TaxID=1964365 RepID=UPI0039E59AA2
MELGNLNAEALLRSLNAGVVVHNNQTEILFANPKALELLRLSKEQALGKDAMDPKWQFIGSHGEPLTIDQYPVNLVLQKRKGIANLEIGVCDSTNNKVTWVLCNAYPEFEDGIVDKVIVTFIDVTKEHQTIPYKDIVDLSNDVIVVTKARPVDNDGPEIVYVNDAFTDLTGYTAKEVIGKNPRFLQRDETDPETRKRVRDALIANEPSREEILNFSKSGHRYWLDMNIVPLKNEFGEISYFAAIERDVTETKNLQNKLQDLAIKDPLTGLYNRRGFSELGQESFYIARRVHQKYAVAMIDIDHFKSVNDEYGHDIGDLVIQDLANCLRNSFRESDLVGRMGGEEFAVIMPSTSLEAAYKKLDELRLKISNRNLKELDGRPFTVSIGLCPLTDETRGLDELLKNADRALYEAKKSGRNKVTALFE